MPRLCHSDRNENKTTFKGYLTKRKSKQTDRLTGGQTKRKQNCSHLPSMDTLTHRNGTGVLGHLINCLVRLRVRLATLLTYRSQASSQVKMCKKENNNKNNSNEKLKEKQANKNRVDTSQIAAQHSTQISVKVYSFSAQSRILKQRLRTFHITAHSTRATETNTARYGTAQHNFGRP